MGVRLHRCLAISVSEGKRDYMMGLEPDFKVESFRTVFLAGQRVLEDTVTTRVQDAPDGLAQYNDNTKKWEPVETS